MSATLGTAALDMRNACARTRTVVTTRMAARFADADTKARENLRRITQAAEHLSDNDLAAELRKDAATATDPAAPSARRNRRFTA